MDDLEIENLLELRKIARQEKHQRDDESRERHRHIVELMDGPHGEWICEKAHEQIDKWERNTLCHPRYIFMWRNWLKMPASFRKAAILNEGQWGVAMRQNTPFSHALHRFCSQ